MTRQWFGTDGIRGRAEEGPLAAPFLVRLGRAMGEQVLEEHTGPDPALVLLARDTRESGTAIVTSLAGNPPLESGNNTRRFADIIPLRIGRRPVSNAARDGAQYGTGTLKSVANTPSAAKRSMAGVSYSVCP